MSILETKELSFVYGENTPYRKDAITNINVAFEQGELVGMPTEVLTLEIICGTAASPPLAMAPA